MMTLIYRRGDGLIIDENGTLIVQLNMKLIKVKGINIIYGVVLLSLLAIG